MYTPTLDQARALSRKGANLIPIYREIGADLETPVTAYLKIARGPHSFLLESVEGGERQARYSFIGSEPYKVLTTGPGTKAGAVDPLLHVERELSSYFPAQVDGLPRFLGGAIGYIAYECVRYFEPRVPTPESDPLGVPESVLMFTNTILIFDHLQHVIRLVSHVYAGDDITTAYGQAINRIEELASRLATPLRTPRSEPRSLLATEEATSNFTPEAYEGVVRRCKDYIVAGDIIQVVPSRRVARPTAAETGSWT